MTIADTFAQRLNHVETSAIRELFKLLAKPDIISFAGGFPDSSMFDTEGIRAATDQALSQQSVASVLQYGATEGYPKLREAIACHMKTKGVSVAPDGLIVTTGSQQALDLIGKTLINPGDKVIVESPTFLATIQCFRLYGAQMIGAPIDHHGVVVETLESLIVEHQPKLIYLIPSFSNPSGALLTQERRKRILALAVQYGVVVVEDDPYGDLYFDQSPSASAPRSMLSLSSEMPGSLDYLAFTGSFSKVIAPGLRVGWLIAPKALLAKATMCKQFSDAHTSNLTQCIVANYLADEEGGRMARNLAKIRGVYAQRAHCMATCLRSDLGDHIEFSDPQGGLFFWARLKKPDGSPINASVFAKQAIEHNVAFVPGAPFFAHDPDIASLRLSFATADTELIREGVARLAKALDTF